MRILPRIGKSAWYSLSRAGFAVPSAESPSTMKSSERATSVDRQSTSLGGSEEDSRAFLRRWVSLCRRAEIRDFISATTFSSSMLVAVLSARAVEAKRAFRPSVTACATICRACGVPRTSLVCPSNWGSASCTVTTAVMPASTSSFSSLSLPTLRRRALLATSSRTTFISACSNPATWVPPFGVAMMFTKLRVVVS